MRQKALGTRTAGTLSRSFTWPRCLLPNAKIVWTGRACGDGSKIQYTEMRAVDRATGATLKHGGSECVARYDIKRATWSRQRFGSCGVRPLHVSQIPTAVCVSAAGGSTGGKAVSQPPTAPPSPEPGTTPVDQQPPSPSPAPAQDGSGSSSSPPPATPEPSPSPDAPALSSPVPLQRTGPVLPRISVLEGETVPNGVRRIEAVTADGAVVTSGLPVEQQVVVGICDSGIDATHPDLNYFGGQSFGLTAGTNDASPDIDAYGECSASVWFAIQQQHSHGKWPMQSLQMWLSWFGHAGKQLLCLLCD